MRVGIYARVSTNDQKTLPMQIQAVEEYVKLRNWSISLTVEETSSGAKKLAKREQIMSAAKRREIDVVIVWKLDRWGRSVTDLFTSLNELNAVGVSFISITEAIDLTTPIGRAMTGLLAIFADFERELLRERVKAGIAHAREQGKPHGRPKTVANQSEEIIGLFQQGKSKSEIARILGIGRTSVRRIIDDNPLIAKEENVDMFCDLGDINLFYKVYVNNELKSTLDLNIDKPTMIVLHGGPGYNDHNAETPFWSQFSDISQTIFIDLRGHGKSILVGEDPNKWNLKQWGIDLKKFCDFLGIIKPIVVGFSFGGWVTCSYLSQFPNHPRKVILCNSEAYVDVDKRIKAYNKKDSTGKAGRAVQKLKEIRGNSETSTIYVNELFPYFNDVKFTKFPSTTECIINKDVWIKFDKDEYYDFDFRGALSEIDFPNDFELLSLAGDCDPEHPWECAQEVVKCVGKNNAMLCLFKNAGDPVYESSPDETITAVREFIIGGLNNIKPNDMTLHY